MNFAGIIVFHKEFGTGQIKQKDGKYLEIIFDNQIKNFAFPDAFNNKFLKSKDNVVEDYLTEERNRKKKEVEKQQLLNEKYNKELLLKKLESYGFVGFIHTINFDNFLNLYKSRFIKSRLQLIREGINFDDNAEQGVLDNTSDRVKDSVRFYYRTKTPTNFIAQKNKGQDRPVILVVKKNKIFDGNAEFTNKNAAIWDVIITKNAEEALGFNWELVFGEGKPNDEEKKYRNAEFLLPSPVSLDDVEKIVFRYQSDYEKAVRIFGNDDKFIFDYFEHRNMFCY